MLWTIALVLFVLWILGFGVFHVAGGLIHILLVLAVISISVEPDRGPSRGIAATCDSVARRASSGIRTLALCCFDRVAVAKPLRAVHRARILR